MATYLETQTRIADEISRTDLTAQIKLSILSAIEYYKRRRFWWNETNGSISTVASQNYAALPTDFVDIDALEITVGGSRYELRQESYADIINWDSGSSTGQPTCFALYQDRIRLYPTPGAIYTLTIHYVKALTELSLNADTNAWLTDGEELIRLHAKADLYANKIRDMRAAGDMVPQEERVLLRLESHNQRRTTTGRIKAHYL